MPRPRPRDLERSYNKSAEFTNRFIAETYLPAHNRRFMVAPAEPGTALVPWTGGDLDQILCHQEDRVVGNDNTVTFGKLKLQIAPSPLRPHFVRATVQVRRYRDNTIALFYGHRCIGRYRPDGTALAADLKAA